MGCCSSSGSETPLNRPAQNSSTGGAAKKEDKIELAFKAKRANVFTEGIDFERRAFSIKRVPKNAKQTQQIRKNLSLLRT